MSNAMLFVYGTLMSSAPGRMGRSQRARLAREGRVIGPATMQGRLYDVGRYPGLVTTVDVCERVHGEVVRLADPAGTLRWLDAYEGIVPGRGEDSEYERVEAAAVLASGGIITAWVYVYKRDTSAARHLPGGAWLRES